MERSSPGRGWPFCLSWMKGDFTAPWNPCILFSLQVRVRSSPVVRESIPLFLLVEGLISFHPGDGILGDINLTKDASLLLHAIHNPFYWPILKKTIL
jgi:hypothetical protein